MLAPKWHLTFGQTSIMLMSAGIGAMLGALASGFSPIASAASRSPWPVFLICGLSSGAIALDSWKMALDLLRDPALLRQAFWLRRREAAAVPALSSNSRRPASRGRWSPGSVGVVFPRRLWGGCGRPRSPRATLASCRCGAGADLPAVSDVRSRRSSSAILTAIVMEVAALADQRAGRVRGSRSTSIRKSYQGGDDLAVCLAGAAGASSAWFADLFAGITALLLVDRADLASGAAARYLWRLSCGDFDDRRAVAWGRTRRMQRRCSSTPSSPACSAGPALLFGPSGRPEALRSALMGWAWHRHFARAGCVLSITTSWARYRCSWCS